MKILDQATGPGWTMINGDCVEVLAGIPDDSIDFSVFAPPFASLYTYSNTPRDMGNVADDYEFGEHFGHLMPHLYRVLRPGRLIAMHCMLLPTSKTRDGVIGLKDFRGVLIQAACKAGLVFHSETTIWKNPVQAMQRTKALGLLYGKMLQDSARSRTGINDFLCVFRKLGDNVTPIAHDEQSFPVARWQRYASPVWATTDVTDEEGMLTFRDPRRGDVETETSGISPGDTLQYLGKDHDAREDDDEKHISPLQLQVIRRAIRLWTNQGDVVLSPFGGIGSEGYVAIQEDRKYVGIELKPTYYRMAVRNLKEAEPNGKGKTLNLFADVS